MIWPPDVTDLSLVILRTISHPWQVIYLSYYHTILFVLPLCNFTFFFHFLNSLIYLCVFVSMYLCTLYVCVRLCIGRPATGGGQVCEGAVLALWWCLGVCWVPGPRVSQQSLVSGGTYACLYVFMCMCVFALCAFCLFVFTLTSFDNVFTYIIYQLSYILYHCVHTLTNRITGSP